MNDRVDGPAPVNDKRTSEAPAQNRTELPSGTSGQPRTEVPAPSSQAHHRHDNNDQKGSEQHKGAVPSHAARPDLPRSGDHKGDDQNKHAMAEGPRAELTRSGDHKGDAQAKLDAHVTRDPEATAAAIRQGGEGILQNAVGTLEGLATQLEQQGSNAVGIVRQSIQNLQTMATAPGFLGQVGTSVARLALEPARAFVYGERSLPISPAPHLSSIAQGLRACGEPVVGIVPARLLVDVPGVGVVARDSIQRMSEQQAAVAHSMAERGGTAKQEGPHSEAGAARNAYGLVATFVDRANAELNPLAQLAHAGREIAAGVAHNDRQRVVDAVVPLAAAAVMARVQARLGGEGGGVRQAGEGASARGGVAEPRLGLEAASNRIHELAGGNSFVREAVIQRAEQARLAGEPVTEGNLAQWTSEAQAAQPLTAESATDLANHLGAGDHSLTQALSDRVAAAVAQRQGLTVGEVTRWAEELRAAPPAAADAGAGAGRRPGDTASELPREAGRADHDVPTAMADAINQTAGGDVARAANLRAAWEAVRGEPDFEASSANPEWAQNWVESIADKAREFGGPPQAVDVNPAEVTGFSGAQERFPGLGHELHSPAEHAAMWAALGGDPAAVPDVYRSGSALHVVSRPPERLPDGYR